MDESIKRYSAYIVLQKAIAIDCGMGTPKYGQLGCLRLDDLREFYIREELRI